VQINGQWRLPLPVETLLAWLCQRWELEVSHREIKSGFGAGEKQYWNPSSSIAFVQRGVWVYALLLLSAYRGAWGLLMSLLFPLVGGETHSGSRLIHSGDNYGPPFRELLKFRHFGHEPPTSGSKKNPSSMLYLILLLLPHAFNPKKALAHPFWISQLSSNSQSQGLDF